MKKDKPDNGLGRRDVIRGGLAGTAGLLLPGIGSGHAGHTGEQEEQNGGYRLLAWNTWLLGVIDTFGLEVSTKPDYEQRARDIGKALGSLDYDIMALSEVFNEKQRNDIMDGLPMARSRIGPDDTLFKKSAGLQTILKGNRVGFGGDNRVEYSDNGKLRCDADAWSRKGVLHTEIELVDGGALDLYSTHMFAGGGMPFCFLGGGADRFKVREKQVSEMQSFIRETSSPGNVTVAVGDFNIAAGREDHQYILDMMDSLGLYDAWSRHGEGLGGTNGSAFGEGCLVDRDGGSPYYCEGEADGVDDGDVKRIDYVLIEEEKPGHDVYLDVESVRRASFWRGKTDPMRFYADEDEETPNYLSDHLALEVMFEV